MKKILNLFILFLLLFTISSCKKEKVLQTPNNVSVSEEGLITWDNVENATKYIVTIDSTAYTTKTNSFQVVDITKDFTCYVVAVATGYTNSQKSKEVKFTAKTNNVEPPKPPVVLDDITVGISGGSEVKSGQSITLTATVTGAEDKSVTWEIKSGSEYATINQNGKLTAKEVTGDKTVEVIAKSNANSKFFASKIINIVAMPTLTQDMLDAVSKDKVAFEGYVNISLYTIGLFEKLESTYTTTVKTSMDGTNWYSEYENGDTGTVQNLFYKKHNGLACQVGVSLMNEEEYFPMLDDFDNELSWEDAGLYNSLKNLTVSDFKFNPDTWRYEYVGYDKTLAEKILSASNPYDFVPTGFALIIEDDEIMGIYSKSYEDYTIVEGYKGIQELFVAISCSDSIEVPTISKYSYDEIHDELAVAIANMQKLESYTLDFKEITASYISSGYTQTGFTEYITQSECYFKPYSVDYDTKGEEVHNYIKNSDYGYKKISDELFNSFHQNKETGLYSASRAFAGSFDSAKPTFMFAPEIFRSYYVDEEEGTITYEADDLMSYVATTFYYGVGNDINLYGIFATRGYTSTSDSFTPYVVVKDGYIIEACFYFYIGSIYGVVELKYSDFNETKLSDDVNLDFEVRNIPTKWSDLTIEVSEGSSSTEDDVTVNALDYLIEFYGDENIGDKMPFFGVALGDTYGFGLTTLHMPGGSSNAEKAILFYYDVPLGTDYTIDEPLNDIAKYLISLGFVKNKYNEFSKDDIVIAPTDSSLDLVIYVWKAN